MTLNASPHRQQIVFGLPRLLICFILGLILITGLFGAALFGVPETTGSAGKWMTALDLSVPAFWASGTPMRYPLYIVRAVDLRHSPLQPVGGTAALHPFRSIAISPAEDTP